MKLASSDPSGYDDFELISLLLLFLKFLKTTFGLGNFRVRWLEVSISLEKKESFSSRQSNLYALLKIQALCYLTDNCGKTEFKHRNALDKYLDN